MSKNKNKRQERANAYYRGSILNSIIAIILIIFVQPTLIKAGFVIGATIATFFCFYLLLEALACIKMGNLKLKGEP